MTNRLELLIDRVEPTLRGSDRQRGPHTLAQRLARQLRHLGAIRRVGGDKDKDKDDDEDPPKPDDEEESPPGGDEDPPTPDPPRPDPPPIPLPPRAGSRTPQLTRGRTALQPRVRRRYQARPQLPKDTRTIIPSPNRGRRFDIGRVERRRAGEVEDAEFVDPRRRGHTQRRTDEPRVDIPGDRPTGERRGQSPTRGEGSPHARVRPRLRRRRERRQDAQNLRLNHTEYKRIGVFLAEAMGVKF